MEFKDFVHPEIDEEVNTISGHYLFQKENRLALGDREILYLTGYGVTDSSCCGVGGCTFSFVPGFIKKWHYKKNEDNRPVSAIETIEDEETKQTIVKMINEVETSQQVNFLD
jgi:hypothetical protein